jgi:O-acetyl-ADP-ribose deacetylase (regulator of RNase III)
MRRRIDMKFIIDPELKALIPPLSQEEFEQLEQNIRQWGCLDPLKVWPVPSSDDIILLDGHNRLAICSSYNVNYVTESIFLVDREAAIDWMIANQLGRRNLSAEQVGYLRGKQYQQEKQKVTNPNGSNQYIEVEDKVCLQPPEPTAARLAKQHGVSQGTIKNNAKYSEAVDAIANASNPEVRKQILSGDSKLTKSATLKLAKLAQQNSAALPDVLKSISQAPNKTAASTVVKKATAKISNTPRGRKMFALDDFENADDAIRWLQKRFGLDDLAKSVADQIANEEAEDWDDTEFKDSDEED